MSHEIPQNNQESKRELPVQLRAALGYFKNNNDIYKLIKFVKENGVQEPYELDWDMEAHINKLVGFSIRNTFRYPGDQYEKALLLTLATLKDAGVLTQEVLEKRFKKDLLDREAYSLTDETISHLKEIIKNHLGWEILN